MSFFFPCFAIYWIAKVGQLKKYLVLFLFQDDITQVDMDQEMKRPVEYYSEDSDLVRADPDGKELAMPQIVQCASAQDILCDKVPSSEVLGRGDYGHQGSLDYLSFSICIISIFWSSMNDWTTIA